ncbi:DUF11 domain-containing protein [Paenibacillus alvei]|nr:DUF11 domain-containing protein [Paenibacillus alvei]MCY9578361.1 DUF11 domain-containing protein [Paenibacillus alvei]MCY9584682.1 DUF11 domain-containing protein [Paenibacillus alvei]
MEGRTMPLIPRFSTIDTAAISIAGQFVNGSSECLTDRVGLLDLITACDILHAELTWYGTFEQQLKKEHVYWAHEAKVILHAPSGEYELSAQDCSTCVAKGQATQLICTADVTIRIKEWAAGTYSLHIPSWVHCKEMIQCGWVLHVIMKHFSLPLQYIQLAAGHEHIHQQKFYTHILGGFNLPYSDVHIKLWFCASNVHSLVGKAGSYYSACSQMCEADPLPGSAGLRQYELSLERTDSTYIQDQLICALYARDDSAHSELYTIAVQLDCSGAIIQASLKDIEGYKGSEELQPSDTVFYSLQLSNIGDRAAERIYVTLYLSEGATLLEPYIYVQDSCHNYMSVNCKSGMLIIPSLAQDATVTITFAAAVQKGKLSQDQVVCIGSVTYDPVSPSNMFRTRVQSNQVEVTFPSPECDVIVTQQCSMSRAYWQDRISFTTTITPSSNRRLSNLSFRVIADNECCYVPGTLTVNGMPISPGDPLVGFCIEDIHDHTPRVIQYELNLHHVPPSGRLETKADLTYRVYRSSKCRGPQITIDSNPVIVEIHGTQIVRNQAIIPYKYQIAPNRPSIRTSQPSNVVLAHNHDLNIHITKMVDHRYADVGDQLIYTIRIANEGRVTVTNTELRDMVDKGVSILPGSVKVNGIPCKYCNLACGYPLGQLLIGTVIMVTFTALITTRPISGYISNQAKITYNYTQHDSCRIHTGTTYSNKTKTYVRYHRVSLYKYANTRLAMPGEIIRLYHRLDNQGNVTLEHAWFADPLPSQLRWIPSSVRIDGAPAPHADPICGFRLHRIMPGGKTYVSLLAEVMDIAVNQLICHTSWVSYSTMFHNGGHIKYDTKLSNTACIIVQATLLDMYMSVDRECVQPGEQQTFTFILRNTALVPLRDIHFNHLLPDVLTFLSGSLRIDGKAYVCRNALELHLGTLHPGCSRVISYRCLVREAPVTGWLANVADAEYCYPSHDQPSLMKRRTCSNTVHTYIYHGCMIVHAASSHRYITLGKEHVIEVAVSNAGTATADEVWFSTAIPEELRIVSGSVYVNGEHCPEVCPVRGFYIGSIFPRTTVLISFRIHVNGILRTKSFIIQSEVDYQYRLPKFCGYKQGISKANPVLIQAIPFLSNSCIPLPKNGIQPAKLIMQLRSEHKVVKCGEPNRYALVICNIGHSSAEQVSLMLPLPAEARLIRAYRFEQNDMRHLAPTSAHLIKIGRIHSGESVTVRFEIEVCTPPVSNSFMYTATALYQIDSYLQAVRAKIHKAFSNSVMTLIHYSKLEVHTTVDKTVAAIGDVLRFRTIIHNCGTMDALSLCVQDLMASQKRFLSEPMSIPTSLIDECDPSHPSELCLECLKPGEAVILYHEAKMVDPPLSTLLRNQIKVLYFCHTKLHEENSLHNAYGNVVYVHLHNHALQISSQFAASSHQNKRNALLTLTIMNVGGGTAYNLALNLPAQAKLYHISSCSTMFAASGTVRSLSNQLLLPVLHRGQTASVDLSIHVPEHLTSLTLHHDILKHLAVSYHYQYDINPMGYWEQTKIMPQPEQVEVRFAVQALHEIFKYPPQRIQ